MTQTKLSANKREIQGRKVKTLRSEGLVPANIYGKKIDSQAITVDSKEFAQAFEQAGETSLIELTLGKTTHHALVSDVQLHPLTHAILHVDFRAVDLKEKVHANVPVELEGEAPAEKQGLGTLVQLVDEIEVEALPTEIPDRFVLDVSGMDTLERTLTIADLNVDKSKVEIEADEDFLIAKIEELREEEEEPEVEESSEGEELSEGGKVAEEEASEEPAEEEKEE